MAGDGIQMQQCDFPMFLDCTINECAGNGIWIKDTRQASFYQCYSNSNCQYGVYAEGCDVYWQGIGIENNALKADLDAVDEGAQMRLKNCFSCVICRTDFETFGHYNPGTTNFSTRTRTNALVIEGCRGIVVSGNQFFPAGSPPPSQGHDQPTIGVRIIDNAVSRGIYISGNDFLTINRGVKIENPANEKHESVHIGPDAAAYDPNPNNPGGGPTDFKIYDFPKGTAAEGMQLVVHGGIENDSGAAVKLNAVVLPAIGGSSQFFSPAAFPGAIGFHAAAQRGHRLKMSDGVSWVPIGGAEPISGSPPAANTFGPGTFLWIQSASGTRRLQFSDGAIWRPVNGAEVVSSTPSASAYGEGALIWDDSAPVSQRLKVSDGENWRTVQTIT